MVVNYVFTKIHKWHTHYCLLRSRWLRGLNKESSWRGDVSLPEAPSGVFGADAKGPGALWAGVEGRRSIGEGGSDKDAREERD